VSWLPVDICSRTILGLIFPKQTGDVLSSDTKKDPNLAYHVLNPQTFHWTKDLLPALRRTNLPPFKTVDQIEWLDKLKNSDPDPVKNPTAKLYDFYAGKYGAARDIDVAPDIGEEDTRGLLFETQKTIADCPLLGKAPDLVQEGYIDRFVDTWLQKWTSR